MEIVGHETIIAHLERVIDQGTMSHAYCFVGARHLGKETIARYLASRLLHVSFGVLETIPDFYAVGREKDEKTNKTKKDISLDQMKNVVRFMASSAFSAGGHKVVVIDEADAMSPGAANALLKTLEEPSEKSHIFLLVDDESNMLPTIRSRCQVIRFFPVALTKIEIALLRWGLGEKEAREMARLSRGLPGLAFLWYDKRDEFARYQKEVHRFRDLFGKTFHQKISAVEDLFGDKTDAIATRDSIRETLDVWRMVLRDIFFSYHGFGEKAMYLTQEISVSKTHLVALDTDLRQAASLIEKNIHPRLLIEHILLYIP